MSELNSKIMQMEEEKKAWETQLNAARKEARTMQI